MAFNRRRDSDEKFPSVENLRLQSADSGIRPNFVALLPLPSSSAFVLGQCDLLAVHLFLSTNSLGSRE